MRLLNDRTVIAGFDFSTGSVKGLAFAMDGAVLAEIQLPTDLWTADGVSELNLLQVEGQVHAAVRALAARLRAICRLDDWAAIGISATHHTAGRIDADGLPIRRAICWNDHTLAQYHARGVDRLGGAARIHELIGGPWASRYSLSHLIKDEATLSVDAWERTRWILPHGPLVAGHLTGRFDVTSVSSAASTGIMDLRTQEWRPEMLEALESPTRRQLALSQLPRIIEATEPIGPVAQHLAVEAGLTSQPLVFPTSDDQQAGLVGGGAVQAGEVAVILGNSAVVNSSAATLPQSGDLDAMRLNWGPYLWMRCYNNGAQFLDRVLESKPNWASLESAGAMVPPGCGGAYVMPFAFPEPSRHVHQAWMEWSPQEPPYGGVRYRAALESLAYLISLGVKEHEAAGQPVSRVIVSGGIAKSPLMGHILASVLGRPIETLESNEGPALGAAVTAMWALENNLRRKGRIDEQMAISEAVAAMVRYREVIQPDAVWVSVYAKAVAQFESRIRRRHQ